MEEFGLPEQGLFLVDKSSTPSAEIEQDKHLLLFLLQYVIAIIT